MIRQICAALLALVAPAMALAQPAAPSPETLAQYTVPHERIDIGGGRKLNLFCIGEGETTVLFDSGGSDWSVIWALVQPRAAARTRACSYDRAGLGYSDPARGPRSPMAIVADLHALIHAAKLKTPLVLVGHSLGGFNMKLYAAIFPEDVAGLVLVDPSEERAYARTGTAMRARFGVALTARAELEDGDWLAGAIARYQDCAAAARTASLDPASLAYRRCTDPVRPQLGEAIAAERAKVQVGQAYQEAQASELANSVYGSPRGDAAYAALFTPRRFGDRPLIVLTHGIFDAEDPLDAAGFQQGLWLHAQTAALSRRGRHRVVPGTHHNIEIDAPEAIVTAVGEVLDQLK